MTHGRPPRQPRPVAVNTLALATSRARKLTAAEVTDLMQPIMISVANLRKGVGNQRNSELLEGHINVAQAIEDKGVVHGLSDVIDAADHALRRIRQRATQHGAWRAVTLYPAEIVAVDEFARLHRYQIAQLSWAEYKRATDRARGQFHSHGMTTESAADLRDELAQQQNERKAA